MNIVGLTTPSRTRPFVINNIVGLTFIFGLLIIFPTVHF